MIDDRARTRPDRPDLPAEYPEALHARAAARVLHAGPVSARVTVQLELASRALSWLYGTAGALGLLTLALPHPPELHERPLAVLSACALAGAAGISQWRRPPLWAARAISLTGIVLTGAAVMGTGGVPSAAAMLFAWPVLFAAYALPRKDLAVHLALVAMVYAALVLAAQDSLPLVSHWVTALTTLAVVGVVVQRLSERLEAIADTDPLTGAPNRRALERELMRATALASRTRRTFSIALIDLDQFKRYNDTHGHDGGDRLLVAATNCWRTALRATDMLARFGGEEFVVVVPDSTVKQATPVLQRLRTATPLGATCSIGVAEWRPGESPELTLARADAALYEAKAAGRDRVVTAGEGLAQSVAD